MASEIQVINPLLDRRWDALVERHPSASPFHHRGWLEALRRTYGYEPLVLTTAGPDEQLTDGVLLCRVSSWLTGTRLVSLPFADHCEPLRNGIQALGTYIQWMSNECDAKRCAHVELRPQFSVEESVGDLQPSQSYCFHWLDLRPPENQLFEKLHKDSVQRKIRRAEREQLRYEAGRTKQLQDEFYRLLILTRRRHLLPPQPRKWFENLLESMGDKAVIRVVRKNGAPIASLLTLHHRSGIVYKYGCSDERYHNLGGMPLLFWRVIQDGKSLGAETLDFGRSDLDNPGLITFKDHWGTSKKTLTYFRYPASKRAVSFSSSESRGLRHLLALLPDSFLSLAGRLLYRHMG